jgi:hypothetical protein
MFLIYSKYVLYDAKKEKVHNLAILLRLLLDLVLHGSIEDTNYYFKVMQGLDEEITLTSDSNHAIRTTKCS